MTLDAKIGLLLGLIFIILIAIVIHGLPHEVNIGYEWYSNRRFNFRFNYPLGWLADPPPKNGDGRSFRNPQNHSVEITGWGCLSNVVDFEYPSLEQLEQRYGDDPGYCFISKNIFWKSLWQLDSSDSENDQQSGKAMAYIIVYVIDEHGISFTKMELAIEYNDNEYHILCEAPTDLYPRYEKVFLHICDSFRINAF